MHLVLEVLVVQQQLNLHLEVQQQSKENQEDQVDLHHHLDQEVPVDQEDQEDLEVQ